MTTHFAITDSPIGELLVLGDEEKVHGLLMNGDGAFDQRKLVLRQDQDAFADTIDQLDEYFAGERDSFDLRLEPNGTEFQRAVWNALQQIPYGDTRSYGQIAAQVGRPGAARAVGMANNRNPIAVIVPCHRVVGSGGALVGYAGGLERKIWLLDHEREARSANSSS
ncbi:MAG: methylated-DNA--[protein]-cysteine S-methyltransferase [Solirubrobacterales bacterium]|nr:methylated-DNA--[protein]-cysteine S-methyltransferase [Solirubrobacterales bacterium]